MHRFIPIIYFYTVSLIGLVLFIIGIFASIHYIVNITEYTSYPLGAAYTGCGGTLPAPVKGVIQPMLTMPDHCQEQEEQQRQELKSQDLEKAISFTLIGAVVFGIHFYFARKQTTNTA